MATQYSRIDWSIWKQHLTRKNYPLLLGKTATVTWHLSGVILTHQFCVSLGSTQLLSNVNFIHLKLNLCPFTFILFTYVHTFHILIITVSNIVTCRSDCDKNFLHSDHNCIEDSHVHFWYVRSKLTSHKSFVHTYHKSIENTWVHFWYDVHFWYAPSYLSCK